MDGACQRRRQRNKTTKTCATACVPSVCNMAAARLRAENYVNKRHNNNDERQREYSTSLRMPPRCLPWRTSLFVKIHWIAFACLPGNCSIRGDLACVHEPLLFTADGQSIFVAKDSSHTSICCECRSIVNNHPINTKYAPSPIDTMLFVYRLLKKQHLFDMSDMSRSYRK